MYGYATEKKPSWGGVDWGSTLYAIISVPYAAENTPMHCRLASNDIFKKYTQLFFAISTA